MWKNKRQIEDTRIFCISLLFIEKEKEIHTMPFPQPSRVHIYIFNLDRFLAEYRSRFHERTVSLRFLDIILRVLRPEVSMYNANIINQFQTTFAGGGGGGVMLVEVNWNGKGERTE